MQSVEDGYKSLMMRLANAKRKGLSPAARSAYLERKVSLSRAEDFTDKGNGGRGYSVRNPSVLIPPKPPKRKKRQAQQDDNTN